MFCMHHFEDSATVCDCCFERAFDGLDGSQGGVFLEATPFCCPEHSHLITACKKPAYSELIDGPLGLRGVGEDANSKCAMRCCPNCLIRHDEGWHADAE